MLTNRLIFTFCQTSRNCSLRKFIFLYALLLATALPATYAQESWESPVFPDSLYARYNWAFFSLMIDEVHDTLDWYHPDIGLLNAALFYATDRVRVKRGLAPLVFSASLRGMALFHAYEMLKHKFVGHDNPYNQTFANIERRSNFFEANAQSENVASTFLIAYKDNTRFYRIKNEDYYDFFSIDDQPIRRHTYWSFATSIVHNFLHSAPHKKNMLDHRHRRLGCGVAIESPYLAGSIPMGFGVQNFGGSE